ncbi:hypothetical protein RJT34_33169 [Clitoria ternatea]|uniref:Uncharacterized protein n=1 Tax=Clitoria ternatea TaxID=43366 RepID=A0AAN9EYT7_CLITE
MPQAIEGTVIPTNIAPTTVCGGGNQHSNEPMLATEVNFKELQEKLDPQWLELHLIHSHRAVSECCFVYFYNFKYFVHNLRCKIDGPVAYDVLFNFGHTVVLGDDPLIWVSSEDDPENCIFRVKLMLGLLLLVRVQKMHKDIKYVLFLDDDVRLHPGSIGALTREMEKNPKV